MIVGLMVALKKFVAESDELRHTGWLQLVQALSSAIGKLPACKISVDTYRTIPTLRLTLFLTEKGVEVVKQLMEGDPSIHVSTSGVYDGVLVFNPVCLSEDQIQSIADRLKTLLG